MARLRERRKRKRLTQEQLAEKAGLHYKFLGRVERGMDIKLSNIEKIAQGLEIPIAGLLAYCFPRTPLSPEKERLLELFVSLLDSSDELTVQKMDLFLTKII